MEVYIKHLPLGCMTIPYHRETNGELGPQISSSNMVSPTTVKLDIISNDGGGILPTLRPSPSSNPHPHPIPNIKNSKISDKNKATN